MPRIEGTQIAPGHFLPLLVVRLEFGNGRTEGPAVVDSGADTSIFPAEVLAPFGVNFADLPGHTDGAGAGGRFKIARLKARLRYQSWIVAEEIQVAAPGNLQMPLLGRSDFFAKFLVRFTWHKTPPVFDVDPIAKR